MSSRIPLPYSQRVIELFKNPVNLGKMEDATVFAQAGSPACGDMIAFYLKIDEKNEKIVKSSFESFGCASNIATASEVTIMIQNKTLQEVWNISWKDVSNALGGLPKIKNHSNWGSCWKSLSQGCHNNCHSYNHLLWFGSP